MYFSNRMLLAKLFLLLLLPLAAIGNNAHKFDATIVKRKTVFDGGIIVS